MNGKEGQDMFKINKELAGGRGGGADRAAWLMLFGKTVAMGRFNWGGNADSQLRLLGARLHQLSVATTS